MITVQINQSDRQLEFQLTDQTAVKQIKQRILEQTKIPVIQQRLEVAGTSEKRVVLADDKAISAYMDHSENKILQLTLKNLGPQVQYQRFFYIEYLFPLISFPAAYLLCRQKSNNYYILMTLLVIFHYAKRIMEARFVHIFSHASVPISVVVRNSLYYWVIFGVLVPFEAYVLRKRPELWSTPITLVLTALFFIFELLNLYSHIQLRKLRIKVIDGREVVVYDRQVPSGLFFDSIISPNYSFEVLSWLVFTILFKSVFGLIFTIFSTYIMKNWADEKKAKLLKLTPPLAPDVKRAIEKRYLLFPFVV